MPSEAAPEALRALLADPRRAAVLTDFDGTLAPIVPDPAEARALPGVPELLGRLAEHYAVVGVVSGRPLDFITERLGLGEGAASSGRLRAFGLYGLQELDPIAVDGSAAGAAAGLVAADGRAARSPASAELDTERWRTIVEEAIGAAHAVLPPDVLVEPKGLSLGLHWRNAPAAARETLAVAAELSARYGLAQRPGRMAVELLPPVAVDKGTVVARLCSGLAAACFIGDDIGDLPAFAALEQLQATQGLRILKVAVVSAESPPVLLERADLRVDGPRGALALLEQLEPSPRA